LKLELLQTNGGCPWSVGPAIAYTMKFFMSLELVIFEKKKTTKVKI
jgi:hypothetical protein